MWAARFHFGESPTRASRRGLRMAIGEWRDALLRHKMVVLTDSDWTDGKAKRTGYIAIFEVTGIKISPDDKEHSFDLTFREANAA
jgi:hypothetical protein